MPATTKDKLEFAFHMGRHTRATPGQVQRLLRYAATLQRLAVIACNRVMTLEEVKKKHRVACKVSAILRDMENADKPGYGAKIDGDPRGCVLKIRVPDGFTDDLGGEGICVPA